MKEQTNFYRWLPWAVALGLIIVVGMAGSYFGWGWLVDPWTSASSVDTIKAINEFDKGISDQDFYWTERITGLAGLLILFVIGPSLWIFSEIKNQSKEISSNDDELKKGIVWYAGVMMVLGGLLLAVQGTVIKGVSFNIIWDSAAKSRNIDQLRSRLVTMAFEASELYYLSHSTGSEGGFGAISAGDSEIRPISLEDLESYTDTTLNSFVLAPVESDSMITIYGIGHGEGEDPGFENANGERGKIQVAVNVIPNSKILQFIDINTN